VTGPEKSVLLLIQSCPSQAVDFFAKRVGADALGQPVKLARNRD